MRVLAFVYAFADADRPRSDIDDQRLCLPAGHHRLADHLRRRGVDHDRPRLLKLPFLQPDKTVRQLCGFGMRMRGYNPDFQPQLVKQPGNRPDVYKRQV